MSQVTTHILNTTLGKPAEGVTITLYAKEGQEWQKIARGITNKDGRIPDLIKTDVVLPLGEYKINFDIKPYFAAQKTASFYPTVDIVFEISTTEHYHVPLLLNPFGYSTYRGS
jgi:5-hydroxyisourate hydrolase